MMIVQRQRLLSLRTADLPLEIVRLAGLDIDAVDQAGVDRRTGGPLSRGGAVSSDTGNPLFVVETPRSLIAREAIARIPSDYFGLASRASTMMRRSIDETITSRVLDLPDRALNILTLLAVVAREMRFEELRGLLGVVGDDLIEPIDRLEHAGLIAWDPPPLTPSESLILSIKKPSLPPSDRAASLGGIRRSTVSSLRQTTGIVPRSPITGEIS